MQGDPDAGTNEGGCCGGATTKAPAPTAACACGCSCGTPEPAGPAPTPPGPVVAPWTDGTVPTAAGEVARARTVLDRRDRLGTVKARWGVGRMDYRVPPGLYAVGHPGATSPVLASANYKLSFDRLRAAMHGRDAWILVLDTAGINVWCAAGKGTFGTDELARRVQGASLDQVVSHHAVIVPQLGAPGVSAHEVRARCGFKVIYGPVRAEDLPAFLDAGLKADAAMRRVRFGLVDRVVLIPVELVLGAKTAGLLALALLLLGGLGSDGCSLDRVLSTGVASAALLFGAFVASTTLGPALLPWLPGRAFAVKGAVLGVGLVALLWAALGAGVPPMSWPHAAAWAVLVPTLSSFVLMNFTGASTYTSLSGVLREMRFAVPVQAAAAVVGLGLFVTGLFVGRGGAA